MALSVLIKPASSSCNLRCRYCFYNDVSNHRRIKNYGIMKDETVDSIVKRIFEAEKSFVVIAFQGGEPLVIVYN